MSEKYPLSRKMERLIKLSSQVRVMNTDHLSLEDLNMLNKKPIGKGRVIRSLFGRDIKNCSCTSYIIPVTDGAITGYLYNCDGSDSMSSLKPLLIYFHGGGWVFGNMDLYGYYCRHLAKITNSSVLLVDYRLAPKYKFPTALEDCFDAYLWAINGVKYWKADPDRIFLLGDSAGGALAAGVSLLCRDRKKPLPNGQILICPMTDGRLRTESFARYADSPTLNEKQMQFYVTSYQREPKDILSPLFSPLLAPDLSRLPETLIIGAEFDPLKDDGRLFTEALNEAGSIAQYIEIEQTVHGFAIYPKADGTAKADCIIRQFTAGRPAQKVQNMTEPELKRDARLKMQAATKVAMESKHEDKKDS